VNFLGCTTATEVAQRIEWAFSAQLDSRLRRCFDVLTKTLQPTLVAAPAGVGLRTQPQYNPPALLDRLALPGRVMERRARALNAGRSSSSQSAPCRCPGGKPTIRFALSKGGSVQAAVDRLVAEGHLVHDAGTRTGWRIVDPFFEDWLRDPEAWT